MARIEPESNYNLQPFLFGAQDPTDLSSLLFDRLKSGESMRNILAFLSGEPIAIDYGAICKRVPIVALMLLAAIKAKSIDDDAVLVGVFFKLLLKSKE